MAKKQNSLNNLFVNQPFSSPGPVVSPTYTATLADNLIEVNYGGVVTVYLPAPSTSGSSANKGKVYTIKDISGAAGTNNISVVPLGGTIDGASGYVINANYGFVQVYCNGSNWFVQSTLQSSSSSPTVVRQVLGSSYVNGTPNVWLNTGLSITVPPGLGTFLLTYNLVGDIANNGTGSLMAEAAIYGSSGEILGVQTRRIFASVGWASGFAADQGCTAMYQVRLSTPDTYTIWIHKWASGGSPNTGQATVVWGQSYIEYRKD